MYQPVFFCIIITCLSVCKAIANPVIDSTDLPNAKILSQKYYDANSLWGYMNGGAELYHEYGFKKLTMQELLFKNQEYKIEYYEMENRQSAFGIFSILRFRCKHSDSLFVVHCISKQQLQLVSNNYYISVSSNSYSITNTMNMLKLAKTIAEKNRNDKNRQCNIFEGEKFFSTSKPLKYMRGKLALQNSFVRWQIFFEDLQKFELYLQPVKINGEKCYVSIIEFFNVDDLNKFLQNSKLQLPPSGSTAEIETNGKLYCLKPVEQLKILWIELPVNDTNTEAIKQEILSFFND